MLEDGCLIDLKGCIVDFCNMILIMILNVGVDILKWSKYLGFIVEVEG